MYTIFKYERKGGPERYAVYCNAADHIVALDLTGEQMVEWHVTQAADDAERRVKRLLRMGGCETMRPAEVTKYAKKAADRGCPPWDPNAPKSLQLRAIEARTAKRKAQRDLDAADIEIGAVKDAVREHHKRVEAKTPAHDRLYVDLCSGIAIVRPQVKHIARPGYGGTYYTTLHDEHEVPIEYAYTLADL